MSFSSIIFYKLNTVFQTHQSKLSDILSDNFDLMCMKQCIEIASENHVDILCISMVLLYAYLQLFIWSYSFCLVAV